MKAWLHIGTWSLTFSAWTLLATPACAEASFEMPAGTDIGQIVLAICSLLALIVVGAYALRRVSGIKARPGTVAMLGGLAVGSRERVVLVRVGDTQVLVGVAPGRVSALHVFEEAGRSEVKLQWEAVGTGEQRSCA